MIRKVRFNGEIIVYNLVRTNRKKNMYSMKVLPGGEIRVLAPSYADLRGVDAAVCDQYENLKRMAHDLERSLEENRLKHPVRDHSRICIEGKGYSLVLVQDAKIDMRIEGDDCILTVPDPDNEDMVRSALKQELARIALIRIRSRLNEFAPKIGVQYGRVTVRDQKTRWGSCSAKHNLNFNWKLIMAPCEVLDYVVIHELCHLIEFNHSPRFWGLVGKWQPEYEYWKKWLKDHGKELGVGQ